MALTLRNVELWGSTLCDVRIADGHVVSIGRHLPPDDDEVEGHGLRGSVPRVDFPPRGRQVAAAKHPYEQLLAVA